MTALLYLVFILSGAAGLIYESIWTRYLGLFVGHSAYAQIIVLVIFLGGMSAGAIVAGRHSDRLARPLAWYAGIEILVGIIGMMFDSVFQMVSASAYDSLFPALGSPWLVTFAKWGLAALLILPQSVLLGATFPLMSAGMLRYASATSDGEARAGRVLSLLYFANSLGAAGGVLLAGFYLIRISGLPGTLLVAAIINLSVGLVILVGTRVRTMRAAARGEMAVVAALMDAPDRPDASPAPASLTARPQGGNAPPSLVRAMLLVSFGTAIASFIYEIAWIRMLSLVLGAATHSFELMLSAFILGLSLGAWWIRGRADRIANPVRTLALVQWLMGALAVATLPLYIASFHWTASLMQGLARNDVGYNLYGIARYALCLVVMLPATFCAGITLPLITSTLLGAGHGERAIGLVYSVNTLGSILGAAIAGLLLLPLLGLKGLLITGAAVDIALGLYLLAVYLPRRQRETAGDATATPARIPRFAVAATVAAILVVTGSAMAAGFDRATLTSGVFRYGAVTTAGRRVTFYRDGRTATVSGTVDSTRQQFTLATNGKPDASLEGFWIRPFLPGSARRTLTSDQSTQVMLPVVTMAYAPGARSVAVIGQGSGISTHTYLGNPALTSVRTIEIEPEMIEGSRRMFYPANRRAFDDPRASFVVDDAKSFFAAANQRFDIIMSEPSNPWVSGVSGLFTTEFYARVRTYLSPDGIFGQWLHLYETDDALVLAVLGAIHRNFASYAIYQVSNGDMLIVASQRPQLGEPDWRAIEHPGIREDLARVRPISRDFLASMWMGGRRSLSPVLDEQGIANSDFYPTLDLGTEKTRYLHTRAAGMMSLADHRFSLLAPVENRRIGFVDEPLAPLEVQRAGRLAFGARLRLYARTGVVDTLPRTDEFDVARADYEALRNSLASGRAPSDWKIWVQRAMKVEEDWHGGTAGVVDEQFYAPLFAFAQRMKAPPEVLATLHFVHGFAAWNWRETRDASDMLVADRRRVSQGRADTTLAADRQDDTPWMPTSLLRDGTVMAHLFTGDPAGARAAFELLQPMAATSADLRARILLGFIRSAEGR